MKEQQKKKQDQYYEMANAPISKIIPKLAVPTIISMLVTSIYNMADTFFVSQLGTSASGAVGIIFSAMAIIQALAFMIGMGGRTGFYCFLYRLWRGTGDRGDRQCQYRTACKNAGIYGNHCSLCGGVCFLYFCGCAIYDMFLYYE